MVSLYVHCLSGSRHAPLGRVWLHLLDKLLIGVGGFYVVPSKRFPLQVNKPQSLSLSSEGTCSIASHCGGPPLDSLQFISAFPILGSPKLDAVL